MRAAATLGLAGSEGHRAVPLGLAERCHGVGDSEAGDGGGSNILGGGKATPL